MRLRTFRMAVMFTHGLVAFMCVGCGGASVETLFTEVKARHEKTLTNLSAATTEDFQAAVNDFTRFLEEHPDWENASNVRYMIARMYLSRKDVESAIEELRELYMSHPEKHSLCAHARYTIGMLNEMSGKWDEAQREFQAVIQRYPFTQAGLDAPLKIAHHFSKAGMTEQAAQACSKAARHYQSLIEEDNNGKMSLMIQPYLVNAYAAGNRLSEAVPVLEKLADMYPQREGAAPALLKAVTIALELKQEEKAMKQMKRLADDYRKHPAGKQATLMMGGVLAQKGNVRESIGVYNKLVEENSDNPSLCAKACIGIAKCYEHNNQWEKALDEYRNVTEQYPETIESIHAQLLAAQYCCRAQKTQEEKALLQAAIAQGNKLIEQSSDKEIVLQACETVAKAYCIQDRWQEGITALKAAVDKYADDPVSAQFLYSIGMIYKDKLQDTVKANYYFNKLVEDFPEHKLATSVKEHLQSN